jgi:hypothetical protein
MRERFACLRFIVNALKVSGNPAAVGEARLGLWGVGQKGNPYYGQQPNDRSTILELNLHGQCPFVWTSISKSKRHIDGRDQANLSRPIFQSSYLTSQ